MFSLICPGGSLLLFPFLGGIHVQLKNLRGDQDFAAFGRDLKGTPPTGVFDTFP